MNFRYDINGLRAIAIIAVVLFHFNPAWVPGGFSGVDVFFVISGFLMTGIIFRGLENNNFSLFEYYASRANRIIPALAVLCMILLVFGWFYLIPSDYKALGKHVERSMLFISNFAYLKETGYFDSSSYEKWLLHTWSLSVEWQFYLIYPILLVTLKRFLSISKLKKAVLVGTIFGFFFCVISTIMWPNSSYYLIPARAWEMLIGGLAFLYPLSLSENKKKNIGFLGLTLIVISFFFISSSDPWPGYLSLIPVIGTYFVIISNQQSSIATNNIIFQHLGKWSYSIYLWHWPIVVLGYYVGIYEWKIYGVLASIILGYLSFQFIESKSINYYRYHQVNIILKPAYIAIFVGLLGFIIKKTDGLSFHYPDSVLAANLEKKNTNPYDCMTDEKGEANLEHCFIGNKTNIQAVIIGDSHADALTTSVSSVFDQKSTGVVALTRASCPLVLNHKSITNGLECYQENFLRLKDAKNFQGIPIVLIGRWSAYIYGQSNPKRTLNGTNGPSIYFGNDPKMSKEELLLNLSKSLKETLCELTLTSPVIITQPVPEMRVNVPNATSKSLLLGRDGNVSISEEMYLERNDKVRDIISDAAKYCGAIVADPSNYLCNDGICSGVKNGRPLYYDGDHMSEFGNKELTPMFKKAFEEIQS